MTEKQFNRIVSRLNDGIGWDFLDATKKYVFMSDMHLGTMDNADETVMTEHLIKYALERYLENDYRLVLLGDTFELAENHDIEDIKNAHSEIMELFRKFHERGNLFIVKGNHDAYMTEDDLAWRTDQKNGKVVPFLDGVSMKNYYSIANVKALHGHQNRWIYSSWFNRVLITLGSIWSSWQKHHSDFHSKESTGWQARAKFDKEWYDATEYFSGSNSNAVLILGHSHECYMSDRYVNCGTAGVMKRRITCTEMSEMCETIRNVEFKETINSKGDVIVAKNVLDEMLVKKSPAEDVKNGTEFHQYWLE